MLKKITLIGEQKKVLFLPPTNPIQIKGVAGSGKTTVALYRAKHLLDTYANLFEEAKIMVFVYNKTLVTYLKKISSYINGGYKEDSEEIKPITPDGLNVEINNFHRWAYHFSGRIQYGQTLEKQEQIEFIKKVINNFRSNPHKILEKSPEFFQEEIKWIKGKLFQNKEEYIETTRIGRGSSDRVTKSDKELIWSVFESYNQELKLQGRVDYEDYAIFALKKIEETPNFIPPYSHIIIDEAQDFDKAQILTISKLVNKQTYSLSIIADVAQRIYKSGFTWSEVGIEVRGGRTIAFKKNYRNTVEIAQTAKSLLDKDVDREEFTELEYSVRHGEKPKIGYFTNFGEQMNFVVAQLKTLRNNNQLSNTVILHRKTNGVTDIRLYLESNGFSIEILKDKNVNSTTNEENIKLCTMSSVKGLEFDNVFICDLNDNLIPLPSGFAESDDQYHISTERRLLYTCMTRARNKLFLLCSQARNPSRYLEEIDVSLLDNVSLNNTNRDFVNDDLSFY